MTTYCIRHEQHGWWSDEGFQPDHSKALRLTLDQAQRARNMLAGTVITTVPRHNGYCVEWNEAKAP